MELPRGRVAGAACFSRDVRLRCRQPRRRLCRVTDRECCGGVTILFALTHLVFMGKSAGLGQLAAPRGSDLEREGRCRRMEAQFASAVDVASAALSSPSAVKALRSEDYQTQMGDLVLIGWLMSWSHLNGTLSIRGRQSVCLLYCSRVLALGSLAGLGLFQLSIWELGLS